MRRNADDRVRRLAREVRQGVPDAAVELAHELVRTGAVPQHQWYGESEHERGHKTPLQGHRVSLGPGWPDACVVPVDRTLLAVQVGDESTAPPEVGAATFLRLWFHGEEAALLPERWRGRNGASLNVAHASCGGLGHGIWQKSPGGREWPWCGLAAYVVDHDAHVVARVGHPRVHFVGRLPAGHLAASRAVVGRLGPVLDAAVAQWATDNQRAFALADRSLEASDLSRSIGRYERAQKALDDARDALVADVVARLDVLGL